MSSYKYLGTVIDDKLNGCENAQRIFKKANQRLYFVRRLNKFKVSKKIMSLFYKSVVESIICFCICSWFGGCSKLEKKKIKRIVKNAKRLGCETCSIETIYHTSLLKQLNHILKDQSHPLFNHFKYLPSGNRLSSIFSRTNRYKFSFVPSAIRAFNESNL